MQEILKKSMQGMGKVVEGIARPFLKKTGASPASAHKNGRSTSESFSIPDYKLKKVLSLCELKDLSSLLPALSSKKIIYYQWGEEKVFDLLSQKGATEILELENEFSASEAKVPKNLQIDKLRVNLCKLPFKNENIDFVLFLSSGLKKNDFIPWCSEISRLLKDNGRAVISFMHPFWEYLSNPSVRFAHRFDRYFMELKKNQLYVEEIREVLVEDSLKVKLRALSEEEFKSIKGLPALLFFKVARLKRQKK
ncbi:MAG: hypothetical protein HQM15_00610 [Deltaproteobacteria bacterium]|nr:hypothetical protein [Deltaproteobacteria bacterium]